MQQLHTLQRSFGRTVLVAGGAGFLGSHLCEHLLRANCKVYCLDNFQTGTHRNLEAIAAHRRFEVIEQDVCDPVPRSLRVDTIFNLACPASPPRYQEDPIHTLLTSVLGARHLLEHAAACGARFLQASTSEVYGDPKQHPQPESYWGNVNPIGPRACYDEGKRAAETLCFDYLRSRKVDVRVARIFNTYGPRMRQDDGRIVSNLICQALTGNPLTIYGNGEQTRSFCYVEDMMAGLVGLVDLERNPELPINLGNPGEFTINEVANLVLLLTGSGSPLTHEPLPQDDPRRRRPDIGRARALFGWSPQVALTDGLPPTIRWFQEHLEQACESPPRSAHLAGR